MNDSYYVIHTAGDRKSTFTIHLLKIQVQPLIDTLLHDSPGLMLEVSEYNGAGDLVETQPAKSSTGEHRVFVM